MNLDQRRVDQIIRFAIKEDTWQGDITSEAVISDAQEADAVVISRSSGMICGMEIIERVFASCDDTLRFRPMVKDGEEIEPEQEIAFVEGNVRSILRAERTALNFLSLLSSVATKTREMVDLVEGTNAKIYDTRKTIPLHRYFEKYAVKTGGGVNHRYGLWDMVLIKDNHVRAYSEDNPGLDTQAVIQEMIKKTRSSVQQNVKIEIEVETLKECEYALDEKPDIIMLDNMSAEKLKKAVQLRREKGLEGKVLFEASGGITLDNVREYAETGVDRISTGSITSSIDPIDFSLEIIVKS